MRHTIIVTCGRGGVSGNYGDDGADCGWGACLGRGRGEAAQNDITDD